MQLQFYLLLLVRRTGYGGQEFIESADPQGFLVSHFLRLCDYYLIAATAAAACGIDQSTMEMNTI